MSATRARRSFPSTPGTVERALVAALALATFGSGAEAQQWTRPAGGEERGWIGISFEISSDRRGRVEAMFITDVSAESPAEEAGLRPGDRIVAINDLRRPEELSSLTELLRLRAGDPVVIEIDRNGDRRRLRLRAAPRPDDFTPSRRVEISMSADSLVDTWVRSMDSLRGRLVAGDRLETVRLRRMGASPEPAPAAGVGESDRVVRVPFEFFVFRGEAHDSLHREMLELNRAADDVEARIEARERELRARFDRRRERLEDDELRRLRSELERMSERSANLESAMAQAARATAGFEYGVVPRDPEVVSVRGSAAAEPVGVAGEFRPLTPYLLGRNRVAGAEVIDLEPELARYFDVSRGVLVTSVAPGTPAAIGGIVPGDVITRIDQVVVGSVEDLRYGISVAGDSLPLTLIREGSSRQVLLRR